MQVLSTPLNEMLPEYSIVETCLLSFNGMIVCDGLLRGSGIILGNKMAKSMRLAYWEAKRSGELIEQFNMPEFDKEQLEEDVAADTPSLSSARLDNPLPRKRLKQLRSCKKEELVVLLEELADEHRVVNDRVNLFLKRGNSKELASELRGAIDRVGCSGEYINHYVSDGVASELHDVLSSIERDLIPSDPGVALEVLHYFIVTDDRIIAHSDDSSGSIGDAYRRACTLLGKASQAAGQPKQAVEIFYDLSESNKYGFRDSLFDEAANVLNEVALAQLVETWRKQASNEDPTKYGGICSRLAQVAKSMGDPELHEEATLRGRPKDEFPLLAIDVARVYFDCGKPEVALIKLPSEEASYHFYQRSELLLKIQKKLGNSRAVSVELLRLFKGNGSANDAMKYLEGISDDKKHAETEKLHQIIRAGDFQVLTKAMYFARMGELIYAAEVLEQNPNDVDGELYWMVLDVVKLLGDTFPLALTVLYRANLDSILDRGVSKIYRHAARYVRKLEELADQISYWKTVQPHNTYWLKIQEKHKRKSSFWKQYDAAKIGL